MSVAFRACRSIVAVLGLTLGTAAFAAAQAVDVFNPAANHYVHAVALQPDGKIVVGGEFTILGCDPSCGPSSPVRNRLARFNVDGTLDATFNPGVNGPVYAIVVQPDGGIVVGGNFSGVGGGTGTTPRKYLARLNPDGSVDMGYNPGSNMNNYIDSLAIQPDGKVLVGGGFYAGLGGAVRYYFGRLNTDGTADAGFAPGADGPVYAIAVQPDGKILLGGLFTHLGGEFGDTPRNRIGRLNSDGTVDAGFNPGANLHVITMAVQADGKILVGGNFTGLGGGTGTTPRSKIGRLNADGTVDASFDPGANGFVNTFGLQADGKILVGGDFSMLGGGGTGSVPRSGFARLNADGTADATFNPGTDGDVYGLAIQPDGKVLLGGSFNKLGGVIGTTLRHYLGRVWNSGPATQSITVTGGGSVVTWLRGGTSPEIMRAEFATSTDGVNYTPLGAGVRVAGGWQLTGLNLTSDPNRTIRARGYYSTGTNNASASIAESIVPMSDVNIVENGSFSAGSLFWQFFATPDLSYINANVNNGVLEYYRVAPPPGTTNQAVAFQHTGVSIMADAAIHAQFTLGNSSSVRKRISVLILDASFNDLSVCTFWIPANTPLMTYQMNTHTTRAWTNAAIYFYAATAGSDGGFYRIDNVSLSYSPSVSNARTDCIDPLAPVAPGGADGPTLLTNGDFSNPVIAPWVTFGQITGQVTNGVFEFIRTPGTPVGVVLQATGQAMTPNQIITATFQLGNSSSVRKRVSVLLHDNNFSDLTACTFWLAPGQPLSDYWIRSYATQAQSNFTFSVYPATLGADQWIRLDNVTVQRTPGSPTLGTECVEPGGGSARPTAPQAIARRAIGQPANVSAPSSSIGDGFTAVPELLDTGGPAFAARGDTGRASTLRANNVIDLTTASAAALHFASWLNSDDAAAEVQVSVDGGDWVTVGTASESSGWQPMAIDLSDFVGHVIEVRFVFEPDAAEHKPSGLWLIHAMQVEISKMW